MTKKDPRVQPRANEKNLHPIMKAPKPKLQRCQLLIDRGCTLIPCGPKKNPLQKGWPTVRGSTIEELANYPGVKAVGLRTGPEDGRIICIDVDGGSADETLKANKLDPFINNGAPAFVVGRRNDPHRYKVIFQLTPEQADQIGPFQCSIGTRGALGDQKAQAIEIFNSPHRQVVIGGHHPSGENYYWPEWECDMTAEHGDHGPEQLGPPDADWFAYIKHWFELNRDHEVPKSQRAPRRATGRTRRANPCPVCGRHDGPGGSNLWCEFSQSGLLFCMPGTTFSPPEGLRVGDVVNGWALKKITQTADGPVHVFGEHDPEKLKRQSNGR